MNKKNEEIIYQDNYRCHYLKVIKNKNDEIIGRALRGTAHRNSGEICDPVSGKSKEEVVNKLKKEVDRSLDKNKSPEEAVQEKTTPVSGSEQVTSELPLATSTLSEISVQKIIHEPSSEQTEKSVQPLNNSGSSDTPVSEQTIAPDPSSEQLSKSVQPVNASGFPASETQTSEQVVTPALLR